MTYEAPELGPAPSCQAPPLRPELLGSLAARARAAMAEAVERTDELVREYLLFRGFTHTLRQLDAEIKADKEKGFRVRDRQGRQRRVDRGTGLLLRHYPPGLGRRCHCLVGDCRQLESGPRLT